MRQQLKTLKETFVMQQPPWIRNLPKTFCTTHADELKAFLEFSEVSAEQLRVNYKETSLGKWIELWSMNGAMHAANVFDVVLHGFLSCVQNNDPYRDALYVLLCRMLRRSLPLSEQRLNGLVRSVDSCELQSDKMGLLPGVVKWIERTTLETDLPTETRDAMQRWQADLATITDRSAKKAVDKLRRQITCLSESSVSRRLKADEGWSDAMTVYLNELTVGDRQPWEAFLQFAATIAPEPPTTDWTVVASDLGEGYMQLEAEEFASRIAGLQLQRRPSAEWLHGVALTMEPLGEAGQRKILEWIRVVPHSRPGLLSKNTLNREVMRGLLWACDAIQNSAAASALRFAAEFFYAKNSQLGDAVVSILSRLPDRVGASELAVLAGAVKHASHRNLIEAALNNIAERIGIDPEELSEGALPTLGFEQVGYYSQTLGTVTAELKITGAKSAELTWLKTDGTPAKSIPAKVKREFKDEIASMKDSLATLRKELSILSGRLESRCLSQRPWNSQEWQQHYRNHPIAGVLARRLIWDVHRDGSRTTVAFCDEKLVSIDGKVFELSPLDTVTLWHPINQPVNDVIAWREWLETQQISQPFKQAHREIYILTDAERTTGSYSNRFAAHILRQSQFRAVAKERCWKCDFLGGWDGGHHGISLRQLSRFGMRAEFWFNAVSDEHETGYTYVGTDQVRFYRDGETDPMPMADVPPFIFCEMMRDIDLFVAVASIGNDPNWGDSRGHTDYWHSYSFGELGETAKTRKVVLERIIPRLKIASRCTFAERFLVVNGDLRTYRIHLGSGNIQMDPNSQYLCIVPKRTREADLPAYLPFEGDGLLSLIISKALLLADDSHITDPTIMSQIRS